MLSSDIHAFWMQQANNQEIQLQIDSADASFENDSSEQAKSLTYRFEGDNVFPRIHLKEGDEVRGFCFVRNANRNIPITKTTVSWRVSGNGLKSGAVTVNGRYVALWETGVMMKEQDE